MPKQIKDPNKERSNVTGNTQYPSHLDYRMDQQPTAQRPEETTNRMIDDPIHAESVPVESPTQAPDGDTPSAFEESVILMAGEEDMQPQPPTVESDFNGETPAADEPREETNPTEDVMGAAPGNLPSAAVEEAFIRGELDVVEEMEHATSRMDYATGRSRPTIDPTPSL